jgi:hypothetical protein
MGIKIMSDDDNILPFQRPPAPVEIKKRSAANPDWISSLDPLSAVRRAMAADPNVERVIKEIDGGSLQSLVKKAIEK